MNPRRPATIDPSVTLPPNRGVKPPGNRCAKAKQFWFWFSRSRPLDPAHCRRSEPWGSLRSPGHPPGAVADQQLLAVAEERIIGGVPIEEVSGHLPSGIVGVAVELQAVRERVAEVAKKLEVVVDIGRTPRLRRDSDGVVARGDESRCVGPLNADVSPISIAVLEAQVGESGLADGKPDIAGEGVAASSFLAIGAAVDLKAAARVGVLELKVQHAGDGVRAVLGRRAIAQHLNLPQRN